MEIRRCLVIGSSLTVWDEIKKAREILEIEDVVAVKRAGVYYPGFLEAWVTLHPERIPTELAERKKLGHPQPRTIWAHEKREGATNWTDYKFPNQKLSASSGIFGVKVAMALGYNRIVLCGISLTYEQGRLDTVGPWKGAGTFKQGFEQAQPHFARFTRSMSGWTAKRLGEPTREWLLGES